MENVCLNNATDLSIFSHWRIFFSFSTVTLSSVFVWILFLSDVEQLKKELDELVNALEKHFFQPEKNNLQRKTE